MPVNLPTLTTQVLHFICSLFYPISSRYLTIFVNFYVRFTLFTVLLYFIISQRFSFYTSTTFLWHAVSHSYNVMGSFAFFVFVRHTCSLFLVTWKLYLFLEHQYQPVTSFLLTAAILVYPYLQLKYSLCTSNNHCFAYFHSFLPFIYLN